MPISPVGHFFFDSLNLEFPLFISDSLSSLHCFVISREIVLPALCRDEENECKNLSNLPKVSYLLSEECGLRRVSSDFRPVLLLP